jgi:subtilase family serine protease
MNRRAKAATAAALAAGALAAAAVTPASAGAAPVSGPGTAALAARVQGPDVLPPPGQASTASHAAANAANAAAPAPVTAPLAPSQCQEAYGTPCYDAQMLRKIYGLTAKDEGQGGTAALIMPYYDPVLARDVDTYAAQSGLPVPDLHISTVGHPVTADPANPVQAVAVMEETLDAEMIVAAAPKARLNVDMTQEDYSLKSGDFSYAASIAKNLAAGQPRIDTLSFSLGYSEASYAEETGGGAAGDAEIRSQAALLGDAIQDGITVMASTGDTGPAVYNDQGTGFEPQAGVYFPASDPQVTAVSGTQVNADDAGTRTGPDTVWSNDGDGGATGGGLSGVFSRPAWQDPYASLTGQHRGVGDVSMIGASSTPVEMYTSIYNVFPDQADGWVRVAGTSVSSPLFTGIVTDAAALAGHPLGNINPALYTMAQNDSADGIQPVTSGCNTDQGIQGYCAGPGDWSLPDGIGTVADAARFVPALAADSRH